VWINTTNEKFPVHSSKPNLTQGSPKVPKNILWATSMVALGQAQPDRALGLQQYANFYSAPGTFQEVAMEMLYRFPPINNSSGKCELNHFFEGTDWDKSPWILELVGVQKDSCFRFCCWCTLSQCKRHLEQPSRSKLCKLDCDDYGEWSYRLRHIHLAPTQAIYLLSC